MFHLLPTQEMDTDLKTYNVMHRMYSYFTGFHLCSFDKGKFTKFHYHAYFQRY